MKIKKTILIALIIIAILTAATLIVIFFILPESKSNLNPENAVGNTAGNLHNGGKFCEYDGHIYFSNPYDNGHLYVMTSDCTDAKLLSNDTVSSINVCGKYIYYIKNNFSKNAVKQDNRTQMYGIFRTDLKGKNTLELFSNRATSISLYGNNLYFEGYSDKSATNNAMSLYSIGIEKTDQKKISDLDYNPSSINNGKIYFSDSANKNEISTYDIDSGHFSSFLEANTYMIDADDQYIYYIDINRGYSLMRINKSSKTIEQIYKYDNGKIIRYNRYGNKIFFLAENGEKPGMYRINADGSQLEYIASGNISYISCTSKYTFFQFYEDNITLFRIPTTGPVTKIEQMTIKD